MAHSKMQMVQTQEQTSAQKERNNGRSTIHAGCEYARAE